MQLGTSSPQSLRPRHARNAGNAVIHRYQQIHAPRGGDFGQLGGKAVAVLEAVGHEKIHRRAHRAQARHAHGTCGCAVGIVVGHDEDFFFFLHRVGEACGGGFAVCQRLVGQKRGEFVVEFARGNHAACGAQAGGERVCARLDQAVADGFVNGAGLDVYGGHAGGFGICIQCKGL